MTGLFPTVTLLKEFSVVSSWKSNRSRFYGVKNNSKKKKVAQHFPRYQIVIDKEKNGGRTVSQLLSKLGYL